MKHIKSLQASRITNHQPLMDWGVRDDLYKPLTSIEIFYLDHGINQYLAQPTTKT